MVTICPLRDRCLGKTSGTAPWSSATSYRFAKPAARATDPRFPTTHVDTNAIEGTQSELVRGAWLREARYRGLAKPNCKTILLGAA